jgi:rhamnosyltransferase
MVDTRYQSPMSDRPSVAVLLASFNGEAWIEQQIDSVLSQCGVEIRLFVSDDGSTDSTQAIVSRIATYDARVRWSQNPHALGHAAANFFHMIRSLDLGGFDYIAFADQDDVWLPGKLKLQVRQLIAHDADGTSSDVIAFWPTGCAFNVRKSYPQRRYDFVFESPGPGCTMLITPRLLARLRALLLDRTSPARSVGFHDWLIYAVARASGWKWHIGNQPTVLYRQHEANEFGANRGLAAAARRARRYLLGAYVRDCRAVLGVSQQCALLGGAGIPPLSVVDILLHGRRRWIHRLVMAAMFPAGVRPAVELLPASDEDQ